MNSAPAAAAERRHSYFSLPAEVPLGDEGQLEREAEHVGDTVRSVEPTSTSPDQEEGTVQAHPPTTTGSSTVNEALRSEGRPLDPQTRQHFEPRFGVDFSRVRIHTEAKAAESARSVGALAYTVGDHVVFGEGRFRPETSEGRRLLGHELAHTAQQSRSGRPRLQRKADPAAVAKLDVAGVRADPDYIDNGLTKMSFYGAEEADLFYKDGAMLRIGLVPRWIKPPIENVDYHTARTDMVEVAGSPTELKFIPNPLDPATKGLTYGEVLKKFTKTVKFTVDAASGKIVPNHINTITAPFLCKFLLQAEGEYVANFDAMAKGQIKIFEKMKLILELALFKASLPVGGGVGAGKKAFDAARVAEEIYAATPKGNAGKMMLDAATRLSGMGEISGSQKVPVILEFFKKIGFGISKEGVKDAGEFFLMKSEDGRFAFRILKDTGKILYGKFDMSALDYVWRAL